MRRTSKIIYLGFKLNVPILHVLVHYFIITLLACLLLTQIHSGHQTFQEKNENPLQLFGCLRGCLKLHFTLLGVHLPEIAGLFQDTLPARVETEASQSKQTGTSSFRGIQGSIPCGLSIILLLGFKPENLFLILFLIMEEASYGFPIHLNSVFQYFVTRSLLLLSQLPYT